MNLLGLDGKDPEIDRWCGDRLLLQEMAYFKYLVTKTIRMFYGNKESKMVTATHIAGTIFSSYVS